MCQRDAANFRTQLEMMVDPDTRCFLWCAVDARERRLPSQAPGGGPRPGVTAARVARRQPLLRPGRLQVLCCSISGVDITKVHRM